MSNNDNIFSSSFVLSFNRNTLASYRWCVTAQKNVQKEVSYKFDYDEMKIYKYLYMHHRHDYTKLRITKKQIAQMMSYALCKCKNRFEGDDQPSNNSEISILPYHIIIILIFFVPKFFLFLEVWNTNTYCCNENGCNHAYSMNRSTAFVPVMTAIVYAIIYLFNSH